MVRMLKKSFINLAMMLVATLMLASCSQQNSSVVTETQSDDATLSGDSTIKGVVIGTDNLSTPVSALSEGVPSDVARVTVPVSSAADVSNEGSFVTSFIPNDANASVVKVVRFTAAELNALFVINGGQTITEEQFEVHEAYDYRTAIADGDVFLIRVQAENQLNELFYAMFISSEDDAELAEDELPAEVESTIIRASRAGVLPAGQIDISSDGNYVVYVDAATNQCHRHSVASGGGVLVSETTESLASNGDCSFPSISSDGRYIAFISSATNLVAEGLRGSYKEAYLKDMTTGGIQLLSATVVETENIESIKISEDGSLVVFKVGGWFLYLYDGVSTTQIVDSHPAPISDIAIAGHVGKIAYVLDNAIYLYDVSEETSTAIVAQEADYTISNISINDGGTRIVFSKWNRASGLGTVYLYDTSLEDIFPMIIARDGSIGYGYLGNGVDISSDGEHVCYSIAGVTELDPYMPTTDYRVFVTPIAAEANSARMVDAYSNLSPALNGEQSMSCRVSEDGRYIAFSSNAQLVEGEYSSSEEVNVFLRDMDPVYEDLEVLLTGETITLGDTADVTLLISGGAPAYSCVWEYKIVGITDYAPVLGKEDCDSLSFPSDLWFGELPLPSTVTFKVTVTDGLSTSVISNETDLVVNPVE